MDQSPKVHESQALIEPTSGGCCIVTESARPRRFSHILHFMITRRSERQARQLFPTKADLLYEAEGQRILSQLSRRQSRVARREGDEKRAQKLSELVTVGIASTVRRWISAMTASRVLSIYSAGHVTDGEN